MGKPKRGVLISNPKQKLLARNFGLSINHSPNPLLTHQYPRKPILEWNVALCEPHSKLIGEHIPKLQLFVL
jgi:hypothetical protein